MNRLVLLLMGRILLLCGLLQGIALCYGLYCGYDSTAAALFAAIMLCLGTGSGMMAYSRERHEEKFSVLAGAAFLFVSWLVLGIFGGLPYYLAGDLDFLNAFFDSISCFTTTGIMDLPYAADGAIILWRSLAQWMGGYMVLLLLSTVLPGTSGCFGTAFVVPGSMRTGAITLRRINRTARKVMRIYLLVTAGGALLYLCSGLTLFDAVNMALVTISTGGCYTPAASIGLNGWVFVTAFLGIIAAGCNVFVYWQALERKESRFLRQTWRDSEMRIFAGLVVLFTLLIAAHLYIKGVYTFPDAISNALFHVVSFGCTNGIMADSMYHWSDGDKFFLMIMALIGGCMGSIAGGFKIFRLQVLMKSSLAEMKRTLHPNMVVHIVIDGRAVPQKIIERILGYFFMFFCTLLFSLLILSLAGLDMQQTMDTAVACLTSSGPMMMFHLDGAEIRQLPDWAKLYCSFLMIAGKINIFTCLLLLRGAWTGLQEKGW